MLWHSEVIVGGQVCAEIVAHVMVIDKAKKYTIPEVQRLMGKEVPSPKPSAHLLELIQGWSPDKA